jgi:hypothetical protein
MQDFRNSLLTTLSGIVSTISGIGTTIGDFSSTELVLQNPEKVRFDNCAIFLGSISPERLPFSFGNSIYHINSDIILYAKSRDAVENIINYADAVCKKLERNKLGRSDVLITQPTLNTESLFLSDKIAYIKINLYNSLMTETDLGNVITPAGKIAPQVEITSPQNNILYNIVDTFIISGIVSITPGDGNITSSNVRWILTDYYNYTESPSPGAYSIYMTDKNYVQNSTISTNTFLIQVFEGVTYISVRPNMINPFRLICQVIDSNGLIAEDYITINISGLSILPGGQ